MRSVFCHHEKRHLSSREAPPVIMRSTTRHHEERSDVVISGIVTLPPVVGNDRIGKTRDCHVLAVLAMTAG
jgi:hypothetical protein